MIGIAVRSHGAVAHGYMAERGDGRNAGKAGAPVAIHRVVLDKVVLVIARFVVGINERHKDKKKSECRCKDCAQGPNQVLLRGIIGIYRQGVV